MEKRVKPLDRIIAAMLHVHVSSCDGFSAESLGSWERHKRIEENGKDAKERARKSAAEWRAGKGRESVLRGRKKRNQKPKAIALNRMRRATQKAIKRCNSGRISDRFCPVIGCSTVFFKEHLESMFKPGMSWINYGEWEMDHVIPIARAGDDVSVALSLNHWTNIRPVWPQQNKDKGRSLEYDHTMRVAP